MKTHITTTRKNIIKAFREWADDAKKHPDEYLLAGDPTIKPEDVADELIRRLVK